MGRPDKAQRAAIARRRSDAIDLKLAGVDWLTIARKLAAEDQDLLAIDRTLRIMERRARLLGLDMPTRAELAGPEGGPLQIEKVTAVELDALIALTERDAT